MGNISIQNIKHYYKVDSFELNVELLEIENGQVTALVGESGCGKTTLLRTIAGLEIPSQGRILIDEKEVSGPALFVPPEKRAVGLVFQDYALFPHLTIRKNIEFGLRKMNASERGKRLEEILQLTHLSDFLDRYPHEVSGGQQQRVALARALVCKPKVLLLDEPFSNIDEVFKRGLREDIKKLISETNTTTIMVSHDVRDAFAVAKRIVILKNGKIEQDGTPEDIKQNPANDYIKALVESDPF